MTIEWEPCPGGFEVATLVLGEVFMVKLRAWPTRWVIEGISGCRREGPAASIGHARRECLLALADSLHAAGLEITLLIRSGGWTPRSAP